LQFDIVRKQKDSLYHVAFREHRLVQIQNDPKLHLIEHYTVKTGTTTVTERAQLK